MFRNILVCLVLVATLLPAGEKKGKSDKPIEASLLGFVAEREGGLILFDGVVRVGEVEEPLNGLRLKLELLAAGEKLISQQQAVLTEGLLEEGDEVPFYLQCKDHPRAVEVRASVRGSKKMFLNLDSPGPYIIE